MTRVVLITGSTDGIGRAAARQLAAAGMRVIVHGRSKTKVDLALARLREDLPGAALEGVAFDLGTLDGVRRGVELVKKVAPELHVLVNNAGIFAQERTLNGDGLELTFAVNVMAPFALSQLLKVDRVVDVASVAHTRGRIHIDDLQLSNSFTGYAAYAQSKLAVVMNTMTLADKHPNLRAYSLHPGVIATKLLREGFGPVQGAPVEKGAEAIALLAAGDIHDPSGSYFSGGVATPPKMMSVAARDATMREALWNACARLAKL
jgi:NAD(P)-dependent dehydrogenase (short-subunit alcohol dehydrogenase family)